jgi:drug/metabolite transporter (DMT)-like permease
MTNTGIAASPPAETSQSRSRAIWIGYAFAAAGAVLFSTKAIFIKLAYAEGINAETLLALRMLLSLPFYAAIGLVSVGERRRSGRPLPGRRLVMLAGFAGLLGYWFASYTDFLGLVYISAQFVRLILFTYPAFVVVFGALFFSQPARPRTLVGIAISYAGLALIFATDRSAASADLLKGAALVLSAAIAFALYQLFAKDLVGKIGPRLFTCIAMSGAAAGALIQFALTQPLASIIVGPKLLGYGVLLAIGATVLPSFLLNAALQRISAQANAVIVLGEHFTLLDACGTALVIAGVAWFTLADRRPS